MYQYTKEAQSDNQNKKKMDENAEKSEDGKEGKDSDEIEHPPEYYQYQLSGVLVHTGSADRGHYYSFIKERLSEEDLEKKKTPQWFEFNDAIVRPFDPENLADECFGGEEERPSRAWHGEVGPQQQGGGRMMQMEKYRNAYLLFYDRVPIKNETASTMPVLSRQGSSAKISIPPNIFKNIWDQNITYWRDRNVYDSRYFDFMQKIMNSVELKENNDEEDAKDDVSFLVAELSTRFVFETLSRSAKKADSFVTWMQLLHKIYKNNLPACMWLLKMLSEDAKWSSDFLMQCPIEEIRRQIAGLFCSALQRCLKVEEKQLLGFEELMENKNKILEEQKKEEEEETGADDKDKADAKPKKKKELLTVKHAGEASIIKFCAKLMSLLSDAPFCWKRFNQYFRVLEFLAKLHVKLSHYIISENFVSQLIDFYLGDESPHPEVGNIPTDKKSGKRKRMGDDWGNRPDLSHFVILIGELVSAAKLNNSEDLPPTLRVIENVSPAQLSESDLQLLYFQGFFSKFVSEATGRKSGAGVCKVVQHCCWENIETTETVVGCISQGIEEGYFDTVRPVFRPLMGLLNIEDSLKEKRVHICISSLLGVMKFNQEFWAITMLSIEHLIRMAKKVKEVREWLKQNSGKIAWILDFLTLYPRPGNNIRAHKPDDRPRGYGIEREQPQLLLNAPQAKNYLDKIVQGEEIDTDNASDSDEDLSERKFEVNQWIDAQDTVRKWMYGRVVELNENENLVKINYDGWPEKWNEWLPSNTSRIARFGKYTSSMKEPTKGRGPQPGDNLGYGRIFEGKEK